MIICKGDNVRTNTLVLLMKEQERIAVSYRECNIQVVSEINILTDNNAVYMSFATGDKW